MGAYWGKSHEKNAVAAGDAGGSTLAPAGSTGPTSLPACCRPCGHWHVAPSLLSHVLPKLNTTVVSRLFNMWSYDSIPGSVCPGTDNISFNSPSASTPNLPPDSVCSSKAQPAVSKTLGHCAVDTVPPLQDTVIHTVPTLPHKHISLLFCFVFYPSKRITSKPIFTIATQINGAFPRGV